MKRFSFFLSLITILVLLLPSYKLSGSALAPQDLQVSEFNLNPGGGAYEANLDLNGNLWISEFMAGELWQINPANSTYKIYRVKGSPSDAHADSYGMIWWADSDNGKIGWLSPSAKIMETWTIPGSSSLYGLAIENPQAIWVTDADLSSLHRLNISSKQLCTYTLPSGGSSDYLIYRGGKIWAGDTVNGGIYQLDPALNQYTYWQLPAGSSPEGLTFDDFGNLWWSHALSAFIDRLNPRTGLLFRYTPPVDSLPVMVAWFGGYLWYSDQLVSSLGRLDPAAATPSRLTLIPTAQSLIPQCSSIHSDGAVGVTTSSGVISYTAYSYPALADSNGWRIHQMPEVAMPWGVVYREGEMWFVDNGRQKLVRVPNVTGKSGGQIIVQEQTIPAGSLESFWFHPSYAGDFSLTDGTQSLSDELPAGVYSVNEVNLPAGWVSTETVCDDGNAPQAIPIQTGEFVTCTFTHIHLGELLTTYLPLAVK